MITGWFQDNHQSCQGCLKKTSAGRRAESKIAATPITSSQIKQVRGRDAFNSLYTWFCIAQSQCQRHPLVRALRPCWPCWQMCNMVHIQNPEDASFRHKLTALSFIFSPPSKPVCSSPQGPFKLSDTGPSETKVDGCERNVFKSLVINPKRRS